MSPLSLILFIYLCIDLSHLFSIALFLVYCYCYSRPSLILVIFFILLTNPSLIRFSTYLLPSRFPLFYLGSFLHPPAFPTNPSIHSSFVFHCHSYFIHSKASHLCFGYSLVSLSILHSFHRTLYLLLFTHLAIHFSSLRTLTFTSSIPILHLLSVIHSASHYLFIAEDLLTFRHSFLHHPHSFIPHPPAGVTHSSSRLPCNHTMLVHPAIPPSLSIGRHSSILCRLSPNHTIFTHPAIRRHPPTGLCDYEFKTPTNMDHFFVHGRIPVVRRLFQSNEQI